MHHTDRDHTQKRVPGAFFNQNDGRNLDYVYGKGRRDQVARRVRLYPHVVSADTFADHVASLHDLRVIFSTWGMPSLTLEQVRQLPALEVLFYAAGSVKAFAGPFLEAGVQVVSAWVANGRPVAEYTLAQILLGCKGYFRNTRACASHDTRSHAYRGPGIYDETVALIGYGTIARQLRDLLRPFNLRVLVVDPYLDPADAARDNIEPVSLGDAFARAFVVSNHLPNLPELRPVLRRCHFASMRQGAVFINTGRGQQVDEADMCAVLTDRTDLTALLDVTWPEPPSPDSPLYRLPNVHLSSHIAGSLNNEVTRMADTVIAEFDRWQNGQPLVYAVGPETLARMA